MKTMSDLGGGEGGGSDPTAAIGTLKVMLGDIFSESVRMLTYCELAAPMFKAQAVDSIHSASGV